MAAYQNETPLKVSESVGTLGKSPVDPLLVEIPKVWFGNRTKFWFLLVDAGTRDTLAGTREYSVSLIEEAVQRQLGSRKMDQLEDALETESPRKKPRLLQSRLAPAVPVFEGYFSVPLESIAAFQTIKQGFSDTRLPERPLFLLYGPRQFGKTTIAYGSTPGWLLKFLILGIIAKCGGGIRRAHEEKGVPYRGRGGLPVRGPSFDKGLSIGASLYAETKLLQAESFSAMQMAAFFELIEPCFNFAKSLRQAIMEYSGGAPGVFGSLTWEFWYKQWMESSETVHRVCVEALPERDVQAIENAGDPLVLLSAAVREMRPEVITDLVFGNDKCPPVAAFHQELFCTMRDILKETQRFTRDRLKAQSPNSAHRADIIVEDESVRFGFEVKVGLSDETAVVGAVRQADEYRVFYSAKQMFLVIFTPPGSNSPEVNSVKEFPEVKIIQVRFDETCNTFCLQLLE
ncbi:hypothetical protein PHYSODRAFT_301642 [Phytophthora sojae]|uniref:Uncharacterized protein n=1 Tax=Phytophthora sojae (strain P6497) TaxID=1094619 RepID=G4ZK30_PHYSP|nr:hypothetical protein PHYSODRAFT_301642 [Phytophthora sojae]EGZ14834.1 hypothetical protein PHYSODRAFT_301642 [Phytophthora sojae]|eukprot:XP_009528583.1 hypothetical protein PHYSODRAFT_301642 [Phytophthora sojae]